jgi:hypothetical protein
MMRLTRWVLLIALLACPSWAGWLNDVSKEATWIVKVDVKQFRDSQFGTLLREDLSSLGIEEKLQGFAKVFGFHPIDDVREILLYGTGQDPNKAVVLVRGAFDSDKLLAPIRANPRYQEIPYRGAPLHQWWYEEKRGDKTEARMMYGCIHDKDLIVMSSGLDTLRRAIDVLGGLVPHVSSDPWPLGTDPWPRGVATYHRLIFFVIARGVDQLAIPHGQSAVFKQTDKLILAIGEGAIGEGEDRFWAHGALDAKTEEAASAIAQMTQGMMAYMSLAGADKPHLADLAKKVRVSSKQSRVSIFFASDPKEVVQFLAEQRQRDKPRPSQP